MHLIKCCDLWWDSLMKYCFSIINDFPYFYDQCPLKQFVINDKKLNYNFCVRWINKQFNENINLIFDDRLRQMLKHTEI